MRSGCYKIVHNIDFDELKLSIISSKSIYFNMILNTDKFHTGYVDKVYFYVLFIAYICLKFRIFVVIEKCNFE
ncbi:hypothetical protein ELAK_03300 [Elizabethkingia anophelis]|nr:hypothetical protein ELAK_03300 [Elizabethkingia anophelis]